MDKSKKTRKTQKQKKQDGSLVSNPTVRPPVLPRESSPESRRVNDDEQVPSTTIPLVTNDLDPAVLQEIAEKLPKTEQETLEILEKRDHTGGQ